MESKFTTAINCMDGRVQTYVHDYMMNNYSTPYVDMITEPGPNKILADNTDEVITNSIRRRVEISTKTHGSKIIALIGHEDCAGNPVDKDQQIADTLKGVETLKKWNTDAEIIGLWVELDGTIEELKEKAEC